MASEKNERVFLWLLEQERQKDCMRQKEQNSEHTLVDWRSRLDESWYMNEKRDEIEDIPVMPCETADIDRLLKNKSELEEEWFLLNAAEQRLRNKRIIMTKLLVCGLKQMNNQKREKIAELKATINILTRQLGNSGSFGLVKAELTSY